MKNVLKINRVDKNYYSFNTDIDKSIMKTVISSLTFKNPNFFSDQDKFEFFNRVYKTFPIGMLNNVILGCNSEDIKVEIDDYTYNNVPTEEQIDDRLKGKYVHQQQAVQKFFERRQGIIQIPTRGGKTFVSAEIIRHYLNTEKGSVLFVVDSEILFRQTVDDFTKFFEPYGGIEIGEICAGTCDTSKRVTVAMIQTLQRNIPPESKGLSVKGRALKDFIKNLDFLIVDEIHDNFSKERKRVYNFSKKRNYSLYLSATPYKSEAFTKNLFLQAYTGDVIYKVEEKTLQERGVLTAYKVFMMCIEHKKKTFYEKMGYSDLCKHLITKNNKRNEILYGLVTVLKKLNLKTLFIFKDIEHGNNFKSHTGIDFIYGKNGIQQRQDAITTLLNGEGGMLATSSIFNKGITLPDVQVLVNVDGGLESANVIQKKGRVLGTTAEKDKSIIIDFIDMYNKYFNDHSLNRLDTYVEAVGNDNVEVIENDYSEELKVKLKNWFCI